MTTDNTISKTLVKSARQCEKRAWLEFHGVVEPKYGLSAKSMFEQGGHVHVIARGVFDGAVRIKTQAGDVVAAEQTIQLINAGEEMLADATFVHNQFSVKSDVLLRGKAGLKIVDVVAGGRIKDEYLDDCAIQFACITGAG